MVAKWTRCTQLCLYLHLTAQLFQGAHVVVYRSDCCCLSRSIHYSEFMQIFFTRKQTKHENIPPFSYDTKLGDDSWRYYMYTKCRTCFNRTTISHRSGTVGGHFRIIRKQQTSSILVFLCRFVVKTIGINSEQCTEYGKQRQSDRLTTTWAS